MSDRLSFAVAVVGGGPAGLTAALYATRLGHRTAVFEAAGGRHAAVANVHNLFGVSEDVSGEDLAAHAVAQFEEYGGNYFPDEVTEVRHAEGADDAPRFVVEAAHATVEADRVVFATGFRDVEPDVPGLERFVGRGLHYCLHCDAYALGDDRAFVLGHDDHAAHVAMVMLNFTGDVDLLLDGSDPAWSEATERQLRAHPVTRIDEAVVGAYARPDDESDGEDPPWLGGLRFASPPEGSDGTDRAYRGGFAMYGKEYDTTLAADLGCDLAEDGALVVADSFETSVDGVYAAGDVTHGQNQTVIALGDGAKAGIALDKDLRRFPLSVEEIEAGEGVEESTVPAAPADLRAKMRRVRRRDRHAGLRGPPPDR